MPTTALLKAHPPVMPESYKTKFQGRQLTTETGESFNYSAAPPQMGTCSPADEK